jgi:hypothetical protein
MPSRPSDLSLKAAWTHAVARDGRQQSPSSQVSTSAARRPRSPERPQRPNSHPSLPRVSKPAVRTIKDARSNMWEDSFESFCDTQDDTSMDFWPVHRSTSNLNSDIFKGNCMFPSSRSTRTQPPWITPSQEQHPNANLGWHDSHLMKQKERQVLLTLGDDQIGHVFEAISPPKIQHNLPHNAQDRLKGSRGRALTPRSYHASTIGSVPLTGRLSTAAFARKPSYPNLTEPLPLAAMRSSPDKPNVTDFRTNMPPSSYHASVASNKENFAPSQSQLPIPVSYAGRAAMPNSYFPKMPH